MAISNNWDVLIKPEDLVKLLPATELALVSTGAEVAQTLKSIAHLVNSAANTGQRSAIWGHKLSDEVIDYLKDQLKYGVTCVNTAEPGVQYKISW